MGQFKIENFEKIHRWTLEKIQKFGQKMKNFEIFFDVHMDTSVIVDNIKKNFKIFHFLAKFFPWSAHGQLLKKNFFVTVCVRASQQKFGPKIKNFKIFFDIIFNHTCVHMHIKKNFKFIYFLEKFLT